jgi:hypothetical protein
MCSSNLFSGAQNLVPNQNVAISTTATSKDSKSIKG